MHFHKCLSHYHVFITYFQVTYYIAFLRSKNQNQKNYFLHS
jgi:hypothetical protein